MKIRDGFVVRTVAGESVVIALKEVSKEFNGVIRLNETGRFLWDILVKGADEDALVKALLSEYDVGEDVARADVLSFVGKLKGANIIE